MQDKEIVKAKLEAIFQARDEFLAELDRQIPKKNGTDVFDFENATPNLKAVYAKFYAYDYSIRKLFPDVYEAFGVKL